MRSKGQVSLAAGYLPSLASEDCIANNGAEPIDLSTKLNLDSLAALDLTSSLGLVGRQGSVWRDEGRRRNSRGV